MTQKLRTTETTPAQLAKGPRAAFAPMTGERISLTVSPGIAYAFGVDPDQ